MENNNRLKIKVKKYCRQNKSLNWLKDQKIDIKYMQERLFI